MSIAALKKIVEAHPDLPDGAIGYDGGTRRMVDDKPAPHMGRVLASAIVKAADEIPLEKLDKKAKDIRAGSANFMREQSTPEKAEECLVIVPIGYLRHLVNLAGG